MKISPAIKPMNGKMLLVLSLLLSGCSIQNKNDTQDLTQSFKREQPILVYSFKNQYSNYILVPVFIKGKEYTFVLDTGASTSIIDKNLASKLTSPLHDMPNIYKKYFNNVKTVSGNKKSEEINFVNAIPFYIGNKYFNGGDFWVADDLSLLSQATGENISGLLGVDVFRQLNWEIDRKNKLLTIYDNPPPITQYEQCTPYDDYTFGSPYFPIYFDNDINVNARLDTGSDGNYASNELIDYIKNNKTNITMVPIDDFDNQVSVEFGGILFNKNKSYKIYQMTLNNTELYENEFQETSNNSYALGMSALESFDKYLLSPDRMLFCYNVTKEKKLNLKRYRRINLRAYNDKIEIYYNNEKVTSQFAIKNGDILVSINDIKYPANAVTKVSKIIATLPEGQVALVIDRQGKQININF